jgi:formylmethanofuran dehydrogenase subunit D
VSRTAGEIAIQARFKSRKDHFLISSAPVVKPLLYSLSVAAAITTLGKTSKQIAAPRMSENFILIPGRTSKQGCGISEGKFGDNYQSETTSLQVAPPDMQRLGLAEGDHVRLTSATGQIDVAVKSAPEDELPAGLLFIAYGDLSSRLMGGDTHGSGMPTSKGMDVVLEVLK